MKSHHTAYAAAESGIGLLPLALLWVMFKMPFLQVNHASGLDSVKQRWDACECMYGEEGREGRVCVWGGKGGGGRTVENRTAVRGGDAEVEGVLEGAGLAALHAHEVGQAVGQGAECAPGVAVTVTTALEPLLPPQPAVLSMIYDDCCACKRVHACRMEGIVVLLRSRRPLLVPQKVSCSLWPDDVGTSHAASPQHNPVFSSCAVGHLGPI